MFYLHQLFPLIVSFNCLNVFGFATSHWTTGRGVQSRSFMVTKIDGLDLTGDGGVIALGQDLPPPGDSNMAPGDKLVISYTGTLAQSQWSSEEVVKCWLNEQQGFEDAVEKFLEHKVDETMLTDAEHFTEEFIVKNLGMENASKIKVKKLVMAAKRLATARSEFPVGEGFDSNDQYEIEWGVKPKLIPGMRHALEYMLAAGLESVSVKCRSDYAYGPEGYRKRTGEVLIPPFASLQFDITLVEGPTPQ